MKTCLYNLCIKDCCETCINKMEFNTWDSKEKEINQTHVCLKEWLYRVYTGETQDCKEYKKISGCLS